MARITNYREAFTGILGLSLENEKVKNTIAWLEKNGFPERSTCYCIWKSQDKLLRYKYDSRFWTILINEVKLNGFNKYEKTRTGSVNQNLLGTQYKNKNFNKKTR